MKRAKLIASLFSLVLVVALLLAACDSTGDGDGDGKNTAPISTADVDTGEFVTNLSTGAAPLNWKYTDDGLTFDGMAKTGYYLSNEVNDQQSFQYTADVTFSNVGKGVGALVFQSSDDNNNCYVASVSNVDNRAELYKIEQGTQIPLGNRVALEDKESYHLQVTMVDRHIAFFVDGVLACSTGDFVVSPDFGQDDALVSGKLGMYAAESSVSFQNAYYTPYEEGAAPVLTSLSVSPKSGSVEAPGNLLANGWYIYQQYVSADCDSVDIEMEHSSNVQTVVINTDTGETVTGSVSVNPGQNHFQIYTAATDGTYQLSYRLHILRRGAEPEEYYSESNRALYHYSVMEGWANDPNGLVKLGDTYHMYYQFYPEGTDWGPMHWYHAVSTDLIHWEDRGIVLYPNEYGTMFSGCAVIDEDNVSGLFGANGGIIAYITANGNGQRIIAAYSEDGDTWTYYRGSNGDDVLLDWTDDPLQNLNFRDPKVFKYQDTWFMVIAGGKLRIYSSTDLINWTLESTYGDNPDNSSGLVVETECPDLYRLPIEGEDGYKWVLSWGGRRYQIGELTQVNGKWEFIADADYAESVPMNFGSDSYAAMTYYISPSFNEGTQDRVIAYNWMNSWDYCLRVDDFSGNTRFNGTFNLNLELSLVHDSTGKLVLKQKPIEEYTQYVFPDENVVLDTTVTAASAETTKLDFQGKSYLMDVTITPSEGARKANVLLRLNGGSRVMVEYEFATNTLSLNRSLTGGSFSTNKFSNVITDVNDDGSVTLHIYVDSTSVELFSENYTAACAALVFPGPEDNGIGFYSEGAESTFHVTITTPNSIWE